MISETPCHTTFWISRHIIHKHFQRYANNISTVMRNQYKDLQRLKWVLFPNGFKLFLAFLIQTIKHRDKQPVDNIHNLHKAAGAS